MKWYFWVLYGILCISVGIGAYLYAQERERCVEAWDKLAEEMKKLTDALMNRKR